MKNLSYEFQLEKAVANFKDESLVRHNVYPDSDSDEEADTVARVDIRRENGMIYENQTFYNIIAFKEVVLDYALRTSRIITHSTYDKNKALV